MVENLYMPNSMRTVSGRYVNLLDPDPDTIIIEDIAFALARECRFGNHLRKKFSVAQHCIMCADAGLFCNVQFDALMHDAAEYLLGDFAKPVKDMVPEFRVVEDRLMRVIAEKFGFSWPKPAIVELIDRFQLEREWNNLALNRIHPDYVWIVPMTESRARTTFLEYFHKLKPS